MKIDKLTLSLELEADKRNVYGASKHRMGSFRCMKLMKETTREK